MSDTPRCVHCHLVQARLTEAIEEIGVLRSRVHDLETKMGENPLAWTPETVEKTIAARVKELEQVENEPPGAILPCRYGPTPHPEFCGGCGGTGAMTREQIIEDLECDIEILQK